MIDRRIVKFYAPDARPLAIVLGTNEIASAVAVGLAGAGHAVVLSHDPFPPVIRRAMSFHDALFGDAARVAGFQGERAECALEIATVVARRGRVAVTPLQLTDLLALRVPAVLVDARMQKHRVTPDYRGLAQVTIGLGPNFIVGANCDVAVETRPAKSGAVVVDGATDPADGKSRTLGGVGRERFVYADRDGLWHTPVDIGMRVFRGFVLGHLDGLPVRAPIDGVLRGVARDGLRIPAACKLLEIDPRGRKATWTGMDERGRGVADATLAALDVARARRRARTPSAAPVC